MKRGFQFKNKFNVGDRVVFLKENRHHGDGVYVVWWVMPDRSIYIEKSGDFSSLWNPDLFELEPLHAAAKEILDEEG